MIKKIFNIFILIIFSPLFTFVILSIIFIYLLKLDYKFFIQERLGKNFKDLKLPKFKTINSEGEITKFSKFLRKSSLDELPNIFNIILGEMSFVGPRPLILEWEEKIRKNYFKRQSILPGITGLTQISGRNEINWDKKFELDLIYIDRKSFYLI